MRYRIGSVNMQIFQVQETFYLHMLVTNNSVLKEKTPAIKTLHLPQIYIQCGRIFLFNKYTLNTKIHTNSYHPKQHLPTLTVPQLHPLHFPHLKSAFPTAEWEVDQPQQP